KQPFPISERLLALLVVMGGFVLIAWLLDTVQPPCRKPTPGDGDATHPQGTMPAEPMLPRFDGGEAHLMGAPVTPPGFPPGDTGPSVPMSEWLARLETPASHEAARPRPRHMSSAIGTAESVAAACVPSVLRDPDLCWLRQECSAPAGLRAAHVRFLR